MKYCTKCGKEISDHISSCPSCGEAVCRGHDQAQIDFNKLVEDARDGNQEAISNLYERTYSKVYYTVRAMIKDEDAVFDIVQDSFIKAFSHLDRFEGSETFTPWVKQIAANTARDWLKKKRPMLFSELSAGEDSDISIEELFEDGDEKHLPEHVIDQAETTHLIREIIEELPEDQRAVIGMYYYEELSVKDIALAMNITESAVKSRLLYARRKIEKKVWELEKRGTKLYGMAPIPFLLFLFRNLDAGSHQTPDSYILQRILEAGTKGSAAAESTAPAGVAGASAGTTATTSASVAGGISAIKTVLIAVAAVAVIGGGIFGISKLSDASSRKEVPAASSAIAAQVPSSDIKTDEERGPYTERKDLDNGDYEIYNFDAEGLLIWKTRYLANGTLDRDEAYQYDSAGRKTEVYQLSFETNYGSKIERWTTYLYTPGSTQVTVQWKEIIYIEEGNPNPPGQYTGTAHVTYEMQAPDNWISYSTINSRYDTERFLLIPRQYRVMEYDKGVKVASEKYDYVETETVSEENDLAEIYRVVIEKASSYDYDIGDARPTGTYRYALVTLQAGDMVPALLLSQETNDYMEHVRVFLYDLDSNKLHQPTEALLMGAAGIGGYRGGLSLSNGRIGLQLSTVSAGTGAMDVYRITVAGETLKMESTWSGRMDLVPDDMAFKQIEWFEITDSKGLESLSSQIGSTGTDALPQDGDRLVLTGTVDTITYDEAVELQGYPDYNAADKGQTWVIVRLDSPQLLEGSQDVSAWKREHSVILIWTRRSSGMEFGEDTLADYIGKHIVFSAGSFSMASDTSVPIGVPWAHDIHILEVKD